MFALAFRNLRRTPLRVALTAGGIAIIAVAFILLRTVVTSWHAQGEGSRADRLLTRSKVSWAMLFPVTHVAAVRARPGVAAATAMRWFGGKDARRPKEFFVNLAVDPRQMLEVYDDFVVTEAEKAAWFADRTGALVGDSLARARGWRLGDRVTLFGGIYPGHHTFTVRAIYGGKTAGVNRAQLYFHYALLDEWVPEVRKGLTGAVIARVKPGVNPAQVAHDIDAHFKNTSVPTLTQDESELGRMFQTVFANVMRAIDLVSLALLIVMALVLGNTIAMNVRERTHELAVMRALGFQPSHLTILIVAEAAAVGLLGGLCGLALSIPLIDLGVRRWVEEHLVGVFPGFAPSLTTRVLAVAIPAVLAMLASLLPALGAARRSVIETLRRD